MEREFAEKTVKFGEYGLLSIPSGKVIWINVNPNPEVIEGVLNKKQIQTVVAMKEKHESQMKNTITEMIR